MATYVKIRIRRDTTANWKAANPQLALGEIGVDMDLHKLKVGDGSATWTNLPYINQDNVEALEGLLRKLSGITGSGKMLEPVANTYELSKYNPATEGDIVYISDPSERTFYYFDGTNWKELEIKIGVDAVAVNAFIGGYNYDTIIDTYNSAHNIAKKSDIPDITGYVKSSDLSSMLSSYALSSDLSKYALSTDVSNNFTDLLTGGSGTTKSAQLKDIIDQKISDLLQSIGITKNPTDTNADLLKKFWEYMMNQLLTNIGAATTYATLGERFASVLGGESLDIDQIWNGYDDEDGNRVNGIKDNIDEYYGLLGKPYTVHYNSDQFPIIIEYASINKAVVLEYTGNQVTSAKLYDNCTVSGGAISGGTLEKTMTYTYNGTDLVSKTLS